MFGAVDAALRISVIDASIIPNATAAFTPIRTIMLAERLAERFNSAS
jgi:choline dehydrogenase-like flavoprotein